MSIGDKMLIIRRDDFLAQLSDEDYESLNIAHNFIIADRNAYIYFDGTSVDRLYFIKEGYVKMGHVDDEGNELVKDILQPGDVFGQFTLERRPISNEFAQAYKTDTILCAFSTGDFQKLLQRRPELAVQYSVKIGQKMQRIENRLINLLQRDVRTRILYFFWTLMQQMKTEENVQVITNFFTHEDIARLTGTSRQTVTTLISQFGEEGLLDMDRRQIVIHDVRALQKQAKVG